jgi:hypothetical protein
MGKQYENDAASREQSKRRNEQHKAHSSLSHRPHDHDIVNQLSIISLCCCELRNSVAEKLESDQLKEFGRIEIAVQQAAEMIQQLKASLEDHEHTINVAKSASAVNRIEAADNRYPVLPRFILHR